MPNAWTPVENRVVTQAIDATSTTQLEKIGAEIRAQHDTYGECVFKYLKGVASTAIGDAVIYNQYANSTTRTVAGSRGPVGIAMSANVANQYGWYCIEGAIPVKAGTVAANGNVYATATDGTLDDATVSGDKIDGARFKTADGTPAANYAIAQIARPSLNGNG